MKIISPHNNHEFLHPGWIRKFFNVNLISNEWGDVLSNRKKLLVPHLYTDNHGLRHNGNDWEFGKYLSVLIARVDSTLSSSTQQYITPITPKIINVWDKWVEENKKIIINAEYHRIEYYKEDNEIEHEILLFNTNWIERIYFYDKQYGKESVVDEKLLDERRIKIGE